MVVILPDATDIVKDGETAALKGGNVKEGQGAKWWIMVRFDRGLG